MYCAQFGGSEHSRNGDLRGSKTAFYMLKLKIRSNTSLLKTRQCSCYEIQKPPDNPHLHGFSLLLCFNFLLLFSPFLPSYTLPWPHLPSSISFNPPTCPRAFAPALPSIFMVWWSLWLKTHQHHHSLRKFLSWSRCLSSPLFLFSHFYLFPSYWVSILDYF